ncbi:NTP_transf_3 domain-containing protein [Candidatus Hydrogenisulfobacillus filiaventi]|uniref:NTP_transf_3 domain-containing protein n=1 Tax=Candidatus Hydrogenisulfobacillus filiaventi TaxID=2707344 RepID=A0A6F8ZKJ1_9FIRM|nr:nucleotidyltransferase family protein [Bacillota bacterium]CAB1130122.1 NTP_transf_3 domain-containing protein [Candidatus Hydrogenisulfobacillus filiaventi]
MHALILAGQPNRGRLREAFPAVAWEALIPVAGRPLVDYVVDALAATPGVDRLWAVGPVPERPGLTVLPAADNLWDNLRRGLEAVLAHDPGAPALLIATADLPFLTPAVVSRFLEAAPVGMDVVYPIVPRAAVEAAYPGVQRTWVRMADGVFTGGNLFLVRPQALLAVEGTARALLGHRKDPWKLARDLGPGLLWGLVTGRLRIAAVEARVAARWGIRGRAVILEEPAIGVDVDKPGDLSLAARLLEVAAAGPEAGSGR